jgi:hypothetical protein
MVNAVTRLESFSNSHAECVAIFALGEIGAEIEFVFSADLESQAAATGREKMIALYLAQSGRGLTNSDKGDHAKSPRQSTAILELSGEHI